MTASISLMQLNIECDKHYDLIFPVLKKINSEVVCVQELLEKDIPLFEQVTDAKCYYIPMTHWNDGEIPTLFGLGIFSRLPMLLKTVEYYHGSADSLPVYVKGNPNSLNHALAYIDVEKDDSVFRVGTTHFTWTPDGKSNKF